MNFIRQFLDRRAAKQAATRDYEAAIRQLTVVPVGQLPAAVAKLPSTALLDAKELAQINLGAFLLLVDTGLEDDILTAAEESSVLSAGSLLGIGPARLASEFPDLLDRLVVACVNDGRIPRLDDCPVPLKRGEVGHATVAAELLKEVAVSEWQGRSSGVSFRIASGVRYHVGSTRGRSVVVGSRIEVADSGMLTVTSQRAVFQGSKRSLEFAYPKLLDITPYSDGVRLAVSNRQTPSIFRIPRGSQGVVATINAAAALLLD